MHFMHFMYIPTIQKTISSKIRKKTGSFSPSNQTIVALSSAEVELHGVLKGASQTLGLKSMAADFGDDVQAGLWSDASAAIAIIQRSGLGKLRRIQTRYLWIQERVSA